MAPIPAYTGYDAAGPKGVASVPPTGSPSAGQYRERVSRLGRVHGRQARCGRLRNAGRRANGDVDIDCELAQAPVAERSTGPGALVRPVVQRSAMSMGMSRSRPPGRRTRSECYGPARPPAAEKSRGSSRAGCRQRAFRLASEHSIVRSSADGQAPRLTAGIQAPHT